MPVIVKPTGMLKSYIAGRESAELLAGSSLREMIVSLGIPIEVVALALVNDKYQPKTYVPQDGDTVKLFAVVGGG